MDHVETFHGITAVREALADLLTMRRILADVRRRHVHNPELIATLERESLRLASFIAAGPR